MRYGMPELNCINGVNSYWLCCMVDAAANGDEKSVYY